MIVDLYGGDMCSVDVGENDAYGFGEINFDAPAVEKFGY